MRFFFLLFFIHTLSAEISIVPMKYESQQVNFFNGSPEIISKKKHSVSLYPLSDHLEDRKAQFQVVASNQSYRPINFLRDHIKVTDQNGKAIQIVPKREMIELYKEEVSYQPSFQKELIQKKANLNPLQKKLYQTSCQTKVEELHRFYLDSSSILPKQSHSAFFEIYLPRKQERELKWIYVSFDLDDENHHFCFRCEVE